MKNQKSKLTYEYKVDIQSDKFSKDKSLLGKVLSYQSSYEGHENMGLNSYKKSPQISICDREVVIYDRHQKKEKKVLMFGSNSYLGLINNEKIIG